MCAAANTANLWAQEELAGGADFNALLRAKTKITPLYEGTPPSTRHHVADFRRSIGVAIFLDRRADPDAGLALDLPEMRVEMAMREFAQRQKMSIVVRDGYLYLGPRSLCRWWPGELDMLSKQVAKLPPADKQFWEAKSATKWDQGATPRDLAEKIAGAKLPNQEAARIAHDIWAAFDGPVLPRWEQLALVCAGFDLVPELSAKGEVKLRPVEEGKLQTATVTVPSASISEVIDSIQRFFPEVRAAPKSGKLEIEGSSGDVKAIQSWFAAAPPPRKSGAKPSGKPLGPVILLSTPVPVPARELLLTLAKNASVELSISADVSPAAVNKKVHPTWKGTRDELLKRIADEIGLSCEFRDGKLVVTNL